MSNLTLIIMGAVAVAIIGLLCGIYFLLQFFLNGRKLKKIPQRPPKNKKKRRRWVATKDRFIIKRKKGLIFAILFLFITAGCSGGAAYAYYYQSINLSSDDSASIVRSYYLLRDFQDELNKAANQEEDASASQQNIRYLATTLAAYTSKRASTLNTTEGQSALNRYYAALAELGVNATRESNNFYGNATLVENFQTYINSTINYETAAFEYFKVNQTALEEEVSDGE